MLALRPPELLVLGLLERLLLEPPWAGVAGEVLWLEAAEGLPDPVLLVEQQPERRPLPLRPWGHEQEELGPLSAARELERPLQPVLGPVAALETSGAPLVPACRQYRCPREPLLPVAGHRGWDHVPLLHG